MDTFFMFGKYTLNSVKKISSKRTQAATALIEKNGGKLKSGYSLLGKDDLVLIVDFPNFKRAMKTSVELGKLLEIGFNTAPAITVDEFDLLVG